MTIRDLFIEGSEKLKESGVDEPEHDARELLKEAFDFDTVRYLLSMAKKISQDEDLKVTHFREFIQRRAKREPLQQILGYAWFMGLKFEVTRDVLIPRPDTEVLCEAVLACEKDKDVRMLDLGTGSGVVGIALKKLGRYNYVCASDISEAALKVASRNAVANEVWLNFVQSDLFENVLQYFPATFTDPQGAYISAARDLPKLDPSSSYPLGDDEKVLDKDDGTALKGFDVIISNPPYIPTGTIEDLAPEVRVYDPRLALDGGQDGLDFYRRIVTQCQNEALKSGGRLYLEIGFDQKVKVTELLKNAGFYNITVIKDLAGLDRVIYGRKNARN